jgi:hypothetical protein
MKIIHVLVSACKYCPYYRKKRKYCKLNYQSLEYVIDIPDWCPLPEIKNESQCKLVNDGK